MSLHGQFVSSSVPQVQVVGGCGVDGVRDLFLASIPFEASNQDIRDFVEAAGVRILLDGEQQPLIARKNDRVTRRFCGVAFVSLAVESNAQVEAVALKLTGRPLRVAANGRERSVRAEISSHDPPERR